MEEYVRKIDDAIFEVSLVWDLKSILKLTKFIGFYSI